MPQVFYPNEVRVLTSPLSNAYARVECIRISSEIEDLWLVITWSSIDSVIVIRAFKDTRVFERFYLTIKKKFRNENTKIEFYCPYAGFEQGKEIAF